MTKSVLAFVPEDYNKYSISVLIGAIEADRRFEDLEIRLLKPELGLGEQVEALATSHEKVVVGFSFMTSEVLQVFSVIQMVRNHLKSHHTNNVILVAGGPHPSGDWRQTLEIGFDIVVVGEGERSFPELLQSIYDGADFGHIRGLAYRKGSEVVFTGRSQRVDELDDYPPFASRHGLLSPIEITRGCPWACRFCQTTSLFGGRMRHRSVENIVMWAEEFRRQGQGYIRFVTPDAFAYGSDGKDLRLDLLAEMVEAVSALIGKERTYLGSFPSEVRPNSVNQTAIQLIRRYCANDNIVIGAQSGSQRMLDLSRRGHTVRDIYRSVKTTLEAGLTPIVDFIFGMPGETESDRELTIEVIGDLSAMGARIHSHTFMPLAGTSWANSPPGRVDPKTRRILNRLTGEQQHCGQWRKQQRTAAEIVRYRNAMAADTAVTAREGCSKLSEPDD